ncbi:MAG: Lacal_2735 family protein [Flavobacteriaceae bacterium]|nr:Lacal_2735 family protein [Flavobacteriaceae bacterium]
MFGLFKKKSEKEKLQKRYERLLKESYELSKTNRKESDKKAYEADLIAKEIDNLV